MNINHLEPHEQVGLLKAIISLENTGDFGKFLDFIESELARVDKALRTEKHNFETLQGRAQILSGITNLVETSKDLLRRIESQ